MNNNERIKLYNIIGELANSFSSRMPNRSAIAVTAFNDELGSLIFESDFREYQIDKIEAGLIVHDFFDEEVKRISVALFTEFLSKLPLDFTPESDEPEAICPDGGALLSYEWMPYVYEFSEESKLSPKCKKIIACLGGDIENLYKSVDIQGADEYTFKTGIALSTIFFDGWETDVKPACDGRFVSSSGHYFKVTAPKLHERIFAVVKDNSENALEKLSHELLMRTSFFVGDFEVHLTEFALSITLMDKHLNDNNHCLTWFETRKKHLQVANKMIKIAQRQGFVLTSLTSREESTSKYQNILTSLSFARND